MIHSITITIPNDPIARIPLDTGPGYSTSVEVSTTSGGEILIQQITDEDGEGSKYETILLTREAAEDMARAVLAMAWRV